MSSPVEEQFRAARLKIERADKHIADISAYVTSLPNTYFARIYIDPQSSDTFVEAGFERGQQIVTDLALMIGDAIHNLRSALDYAWIGALMTHATPVTSNDKLPIYPTAQMVEGALKKRKIDSSNPLYDLVLTWIKPYDRGNDAIRAVHILDRRDKHSLLLPLLHVSFNRIKVTDERGNIEMLDWAMTRPGPCRQQVTQGSKIHDQGKVGVTVVFHEGTPTHDADILSVLTEFRQAAISVVELLQGM